jgi:hypothetical protein
MYRRHAYLSWQMVMGIVARNVWRIEYAGDITAIVGRDTRIVHLVSPRKAKARAGADHNFLQWTRRRAGMGFSTSGCNYLFQITETAQ